MEGLEEKVYEMFDKLNIKYEKIKHPALFTYSDSIKYNIKLNGTICKNLFIKNKNKSKYYLVALPLEKKADLKMLQEKLQETKLSFGNEKTLEEKLKIKSGSVSVLNVVNTDNTDVIFVIDNEMFKSGKVGFHPNVNTATVLFSPNEIKKILDNYNVSYKFIDL